MLQGRIINKSKISILRMVKFGFYAFMAVIVMTFSVIYITAQKRYSHKYHEDALRSSAYTKSVLLNDYFKADLAHLEVMSKSPIITAFMANPNDTSIHSYYWKELQSYKNLLQEHRKIFFVSNTDNRFYFDTNYAYVVNAKDPGSYWYDSTLYRTPLYNFNIDFDKDLDTTLMWINFPVFHEGKSVGVLGVGIDIDSFASEMEKTSGIARNFIIFNENKELLLYKSHDHIKNKSSVLSILPETLVDELLELLETKDYNLLFKGDTAYIINRVPFMSSYLVASAKTDFIVGLGEFYLIGILLLFIVTSTFLIILYKFIKTILSPLHYFSSLTNTILKEVPIYIAVFDSSGKITLISRHMSDLLCKGDILEEFRSKKGFYEATKEFGVNNGKSNYFKIVKMDMEQQESDEQNSIIYLLDVSEQMYLANTDVLTNIANKRYFNERAKAEFNNSQRDKMSIAFLMLDIDFFKKFNDKFGHLAGDEILKEIANVLAQVVERKTDLVGRVGGEEFAVMLHSTDLGGAKTVAEKIRSEIENRAFQIGGIQEIIKITVSIGVYSAVPHSSANLKQFLEEADKKLYEAKFLGRNRVCC
ncbi:MAG: sensor domain-containing diguanylate cyclase [Fibromonadaceae bacterium]|jgi:diguanylate cyclase (GGDEF)-like protein|nr:sensor domain-containing diguanylate cyclase [Fibromonadaceae bacterium]